MATRIIVVKNNLPACAAQTLTGANELSTDVAKDIQQAAKAAAPVRTGRLRAGINLKGGNPAEVTASSIEGGATREYAAYNEYGTRYMSPQPFMMPAYAVGLAQVPIHGREYGAKIEAVA